MSIFDLLPTFYEAPLTYIIVPIILVSSIIGFYNKPYFHALLIHPYELFRGKRWHTLLTSAFLHRNWLHLSSNLFFIYVLSYDLYGTLKQIYPNGYPFLLSGLICFLLITLPNLAQSIHKKDDFMFTSMGSSGLSFGLFGFTGMLLPTDSTNKFMFIFIGNSFYNWLVLLIILYVLTRIKRSSGTNVYLHLYAFLIGGLLALLVRPEAVKEIISIF